MHEPAVTLTERFASVMPALFGAGEEGGYIDGGLAQRARRAGLYFHVLGDSWPAMNLPSMPAFDPITAVLLALGLAIAVGRFWQGPHAFLALWFLVTLIGGEVLTQDFRGHRFALAIPAAFLLAGVCIKEVWGSAQCLPTRLRRWSWTMLCALCLLAVGSNLGIFFGRQIHDERVRAEFDREISAVASHIAGFGGSRYVYLFANYPFFVPGQDFAWLAEDPPGERALSLSAVLPARSSGDMDVAYLFGYPYAGHGLPQLVQRMYPRAHVETLESPYGRWSVEVVLVGKEEVALRRGLHLRVWKGFSQMGPPAWEGRVPAVDMELEGVENLPSAPFVVEWRGAIFAHAFGTYAFASEGDVPLRMWVDDAPAVGKPLLLAEGWHTLRVSAVVEGAPAGGRFLWRPPERDWERIPGDALMSLAEWQGVSASFFEREEGNDPFAEPPANPIWQRVEPTLYMGTVPTEWGGAPAAELAGRPFCVHFEGVLHLDQGGVYAFQAISRGGSFRFGLNDTWVIIRPQGGDAPEMDEASLSLPAGEQILRADFCTNPAEFHDAVLFWRRPGAAAWELIPPTALSPRRGEGE